MSNVNKSTAIITFLQTCPTIQSNPLFFNFGNIENNANQASIQSDEVALQKPFIDGSVSKRFTFIIDTFKSIGYTPIVTGKSDENSDDFEEVQSIIDWINTKGEQEIYPTFGSDYIIENMKTTKDKPEVIGVNTNVDPPMAIYRISIQIDYIDISKRIWN